MATTAPETTQAGWLDPFLADWRPGTGEPRETREPATGRPLLSLAQSTVEDVARAAVAAAAAQPAWADTSYAERAAVLRRAAEIYEAHRPEFGTWTQRETGAVHGKMHHEQNFAAGEINAAATMPFQPYGQLVPSVVPGRLSMLRRVPAGVIGAITPWNSPTVLGMRVVAPALALGNAVILKPDPQTAVCGGAVFEAVFREAGLPDGLLHVVLGGAEVGEAIVTDPNVNRVSFTGSTAAGRRVGTLAGQLLKRVSLELGGNNAFVVLDDADLEAAASAGAFASFQFQGQVCFATGRHIVHRSIASDYVALLSEKADATPARRPVPRGRRPRADRQPEAARAGGRDRAAIGRRRRPGRRRWHARGALLSPDRPDRRHAPTTRPGARRSSGRSRRSSCSTPTTRRSRSPTTASTG